MDSFETDNVKVEKANAMLRYRRLRKFANLLRLVEVCVVLILLSWLSARLPIAVKISGDYFRDLFDVLVSPRFVFLVGNAIVITLFAKSGQFSSPNTTGNNAGSDFYGEFVENKVKHDKFRTDGPASASELAEIVYEDKQIVCEENTVTPSYPDIVTTVTNTAPDTKIYRRSQSENLKREMYEKFQRSETEKCWKIMNHGEYPAEMSYREDTNTMSNEEFRRKIEGFIARQVRFHREESLAIVLPNHS
ncbi:hypothetical protein HHK36_010163 [Tetracentron sinense]|uniref:DUF4408 domain-containing protein n=1 Tax=Tetracentron sinense TaxID=13715 RepID=A0A834ZMW9_TETSI|nr:hypothetical protein HHK36_010163 [Tetracentron sinense]